MAESLEGGSPPGPAEARTMVPGGCRTQNGPLASPRTGRWMREVGAPPWNRTKNLMIQSHLLCQLS
jgi:hypothetical protein